MKLPVAKFSVIMYFAVSTSCKRFLITISFSFNPVRSQAVTVIDPSLIRRKLFFSPHPSATEINDNPKILNEKLLSNQNLQHSQKI